MELISATMIWRYIPTETHSAAMNMALDEACLTHMSEGKVPPTIRFYRWQPSAISIGYFQNLQREVDTKVCQELGVDIVRRQTGGGAVYHDHDGELTYSVLAPAENFPKNIIKSYEEICSWIIDALSRLKIDSEFVPINDIVTNGKKISGNAQTRKKGILLQHGTILYQVDVKKMFSMLLVPDEKIRDKMIAVVEERVTSVVHQKPEVTFADLEQAFADAFLEGKEFQVGSWTESELQLAEQLAKEKYGAEAWNLHRNTELPVTS